MKLSDAIAALGEGKKVCREGWPEGKYWDGRPVCFAGPMAVENIDGEDHYKQISISFSDFAGPWKLYEEPGRDFEWALEQMKAGVKVKRREWSAPAHSAAVVIYADISATDWELA